MNTHTAEKQVPAENKAVLHFPQGLYGFEDHKDFTLSESEYGPFMWLQSVREKEPAFLTVDPFLFFPDYELDVDEESLKDIGIESVADVSVIVIVTLPKNVDMRITANLQGPLVINKHNKQGRQIVLQDPRWLTKHALPQASDSVRSGQC